VIHVLHDKFLSAYKYFLCSYMLKAFGDFIIDFVPTGSNQCAPAWHAMDANSALFRALQALSAWFLPLSRLRRYSTVKANPRPQPPASSIEDIT
jgi:hypothetical protein